MADMFANLIDDLIELFAVEAREPSCQRYHRAVVQYHHQAMGILQTHGIPGFQRVTSDRDDTTKGHFTAVGLYQVAPAPTKQIVCY